MSNTTKSLISRINMVTITKSKILKLFNIKIIILYHILLLELSLNSKLLSVPIVVNWNSIFVPIKTLE